jgi:Ca2+-binding EF-hand superfamily protein
MPAMPFTSPERASELAAMFGLCDRDDDGRIDQAEFGELMESLGENGPATAAAARFTKIDRDGDGYVTLAEFMEWWQDE